MCADLYYTIPKFFEDRMREHSMVESFEKMNVKDEHIYEITRKKYADTVRIWLSDAYIFTSTDYYNRPKELRAGDYIVIAKPEGGGGANEDLIERTRIGVGKLGELMGALYVRDMWTYEPPSEEERRTRKERFLKKNKPE